MLGLAGLEGLSNLLLQQGEGLAAGVEKVSDHGTIGPRKYFGSQKETDHT